MSYLVAFLDWFIVCTNHSKPSLRPSSFLADAACTWKSRPSSVSFNSSATSYKETNNKVRRAVKNTTRNTNAHNLRLLGVPEHTNTKQQSAVLEGVKITNKHKTLTSAGLLLNKSCLLAKINTGIPAILSSATSLASSVLHC